MNQTRLGSLIEVAFNILIGFSINWVANMVILPMYGFQITGGQAFSMGLFYTVISVVRSYVIRRWFNARLRAAAESLAAQAQGPATEVTQRVEIHLPAMQMKGPALCDPCGRRGFYTCHCPTVASFNLAGQEFTQDMVDRMRQSR